MASSLSDGTLGRRPGGAVPSEPVGVRGAGADEALWSLQSSLDFRQRPEEFLAEAAEEFHAVLNARSVVVYVPRNSELVPEIARGTIARAPAPREGLVWWAARSGKPVCLDARSPSDRGQDEPALLAGQPALIIPIAKPEVLYAVVQVQRDGRGFTPSEVEAAKRLATIIARNCEAAELYRLQQEHAAHLEVTLEENRQLHRQIQAQAARLRESLRQMGVALAAGVDLAETLQAIVEIACRILQAKSGILRLREGDLLVTKAMLGDEAMQALRDFTFRVGEGIVGQVVAFGRPVTVNRFDDIDYPFRSEVEAAGIQSLLSVPILSAESGVAIGSLTVHNKEGGQPFGKDDEQTLMAFAAHAYGAVEKAVLREKQRDAAAEAAVLQEVAAATSSLDLEEVLRIACRKMIEVAEVDRCVIFLWDSGKNELRCAEGQGLPEATLERLRELRLRFDHTTDGLWQRLASGEAVAVPEGGEPSRLLRRILGLFRAKQCLLAPLLARGRLIGAVYLEDTHRSHLADAWQGRLLRGISRQLATAIDRARLYAQNEQRVLELTALNRVSAAAASTLDLGQLLDQTLSETLRAFNASAGSIMLYHPEPDHLKVAAQVGLPDRLGKRATRKMGEGIAGWVAQHREPLLTSNLVADPRFKNLMDRSDVESAMVVPLVSKGTLLGVLSISAGSSHQHFSEDDLSLLTTISRQLAVAIENCLHFDAERQIAQIARRAVMPRAPLVVSNLDIGEKHIPAQDVGGDYYDIFPLGQGRVGVLVSDVSGKSVTAAMHGAMGKNYIRALAQALDSPAAVLREANKLLVADTPTEIFVSAFYGVLDVERHLLTYASAGHCPPYVIGLEGQVRELPGTGMLLGLWTESTYGEAVVELHAQDTLLCYTDGITEAKRGGKLFGDARLRSCAVRYRHESAQTIADRLYRRTLTYCGKRMEDDIAILVVKILE